MALQNLGEPTLRPNDYVTLTYLQNNYPSTSARVVSYGNYTIALPSSPVDHAMFVVEVVAGSTAILVTIPGTVLLTAGVFSSYTLQPHKTGFFGFRYSAAASSWFALSAALQN
jgi:hypothetical protein